jgi:hypothetical protein
MVAPCEAAWLRRRATLLRAIPRGGGRPVATPTSVSPGSAPGARSQHLLISAWSRSDPREGAVGGGGEATWRRCHDHRGRWIIPTLQGPPEVRANAHRRQDKGATRCGTGVWALPRTPGKRSRAPLRGFRTDTRWTFRRDESGFRTDTRWTFRRDESAVWKADGVPVRQPAERAPVFACPGCGATPKPRSYSGLRPYPGAYGANARTLAPQRVAPIPKDGPPGRLTRTPMQRPLAVPQTERWVEAIGLKPPGTAGDRR